MEKPGKKEDEETEINQAREEGDHGDEGKTEGPLDKYMKIILEARMRKQTKVSVPNVCETKLFQRMNHFLFSL